MDFSKNDFSMCKMLIINNKMLLHLLLPAAYHMYLCRQ